MLILYESLHFCTRVPGTGAESSEPHQNCFLFCVSCWRETCWKRFILLPSGSTRWPGALAPLRLAALMFSLHPSPVPPYKKSKVWASSSQALEHQPPGAASASAEYHPYASAEFHPAYSTRLAQCMWCLQYETDSLLLASCQKCNICTYCCIAALVANPVPNCKCKQPEIISSLSGSRCIRKAGLAAGERKQWAVSRPKGENLQLAPKSVTDFLELPPEARKEQVRTF